MSLYKIYCTSYNNPIRLDDMNKKFNQLELEVQWFPGVEPTDPRISPDRKNKKGDANMLAHLDMITSFLNSDAEFGIFCEDDIYIRKSFKQDILFAIEGFKNLNLRVLLLGCLLPYHPNKPNPEEPFHFFNIFPELWGTQMFMLNKDGAKEILEKFPNAEIAEKTAPFSPDWSISKIPRGAFIYPMLAIEKNYSYDSTCSHSRFHNYCERIHYNPELYI